MSKKQQKKSEDQLRFESGEYDSAPEEQETEKFNYEKHTGFRRPNWNG